MDTQSRFRNPQGFSRSLLCWRSLCMHVTFGIEIKGDTSTAKKRVETELEATGCSLGNSGFCQSSIESRFTETRFLSSVRGVIMQVLLLQEWWMCWGDESALLDAIAVVEEMREKYPYHFATLTRVPATFVKNPTTGLVYNSCWMLQFFVDANAWISASLPQLYWIMYMYSLSFRLTIYIYIWARNENFYCQWNLLLQLVVSCLFKVLLFTNSHSWVSIMNKIELVNPL